MVLAMGKFQVSKYANPGGGGGSGIDFGLNPGQGNVFGEGGMGQLVPSNVSPQLIGPGGEVLPGVGGSPYLPGGVPMTPAYPGGPGSGPFWDPSTLPGRPGGRGGPRHGSRIIHVTLPKMIMSGQPFSIIVTYVHQGQEGFGTYKVKVNIPVLQIMETSPEKRVANGGQDNIVINLTAPIPLPNAAITGTVELVQTEGNDVTVDSEVIVIPSELVPNPPSPVPPELPPIPLPLPLPSPPPVLPPPPPVPLPPVMQLITLTITRGQDGGHQAIIIQANGLEPSEPATLFVYLSSLVGAPPPSYRDWRTGLQYGAQASARAGGGATANAGSQSIVQNASSNMAYAYPVSIQGITPNGNGLRLGGASRMLDNMKSKSSSRGRPEIQNLVNERVKERLNMAPQGRVQQMIKSMAGNNTVNERSISNEVEGIVQSIIQTAADGGNINQTAINNVASGDSAGALPKYLQPPGPVPPIVIDPIFKRQKVSLTASAEGTIRHVVRVREAQVGSPMHGFVVVYGHRSKRHSGRKPFSL